MNARNGMLGWAVAEVVLAMPAISGLLTLALAASIRSVRSVPREVFLQAVAYPFAGAATGAVLGTGFGEMATSRPDAVFLLGGGIVLQLCLGGLFARNSGRIGAPVPSSPIRAAGSATSST